MLIKKLAVASALTVVLAACGGGGDRGTRPDSDASSNSQIGSGVERVDETIASGGSINDDAIQAVSLEALNDPNSPLAKRIIYFDYDSSEISAEYHSTLQAHAQLLAANPNVRIRLEGHTDERGSREYNIGLGYRRANTVLRYLEVQGVSAAQLESISYGEEKPARYEHSPQAWDLNRRVELKYTQF